MSDPGTEYAGLSWQQIQEDILSGNPASLSSAADVLSTVQQGLSDIAQAVDTALGNLTGGTSSSWQGPAAQAFATATGSLVSGIQSLSDILQSSSGDSISNLLNQNGSTLSWAQTQIQAIDGEFAITAAQAGVPVSQSGLVSPTESMSQQITAEMLAVLEQLAQNYDQTIAALQNPIQASSESSSGSDDGSGSSDGASDSGTGTDTGTGSGAGDLGGTSANAVPGSPPGQADFALSGTSSNTGSGASADSAAASTGSDGSDSSGSGVGSWIDQAFSILQASGVPASQLNSSDVNLIIQHESGGDPSAVNNSDSNAAAGDPSQGLMQTTGDTFNTYAMPGHNSNILDPVSNIIAGVRYALATYGALGNVPGVVAVDSGGSYLGY